MSWTDILPLTLSQNTLHYPFVVQSVLRIWGFFTFLVFTYLFIQGIFIEYLLRVSLSYRHLGFIFTEKAVTENKQINRATKISKQGEE